VHHTEEQGVTGNTSGPKRFQGKAAHQTTGIDDMKYFKMVIANRLDYLKEFRSRGKEAFMHREGSK
jgi:hypothetical protein